jgi:dolichol-phosphate mannosyltransferase
LSRNFGAHIALSAGICHATGDAVVTLACDLQDPPEVVLQFLQAWRDGARIVWGRRRKREDSRWRILASHLFYNLARRFAMPRGSKFATGSFLLLDRRVVDCFRQFREHNRLTFALVAWTGFDQAVVEYDRQKRQRGESGWTLPRMVKSSYDTLISFSPLPASLMTGLGLGAFLAALPLSAYTLICWLVSDPLRGWTSLMLALFCLFGTQFLLMGLIGEYLYRIYTEVVGRPLYVISEATVLPEERSRDAA